MRYMNKKSVAILLILVLLIAMILPLCDARGGGGGGRGGGGGGGARGGGFGGAPPRPSGGGGFGDSGFGGVPPRPSTLPSGGSGLRGVPGGVSGSRNLGSISGSGISASGKVGGVASTLPATGGVIGSGNVPSQLPATGAAIGSGSGAVIGGVVGGVAGGVIGSGNFPTQLPANIGSGNVPSQLPWGDYWTKPSVPPVNIITPPQNIIVNWPGNVYVGYDQGNWYPISYSQYTSDPSYQGSNSLWIQGKTSWSQYAQVPLGSSVQLVAITPTQGNGYLSMTDSSGKMTNYDYVFYPSNSLSFYADAIGKHTIAFMVNGISSNPVVIDVVGTQQYNQNYPSNGAGVIGVNGGGAATAGSI